jgi:hypothetical protein
MRDATYLRTLKQCVYEAPVCTRNSLCWLIAIADDHGFQGCVVKVAGWMCIDPVAVTDRLAQQQARPLPHQRRMARKRLTPARQREPTAVGCGITRKGEPQAVSSQA